VRLLIPPKFPHIPWNDEPVLYETLEDPEGLPASMSSIGSGFPEHWKHSSFQPLQDLFTALRSMAGYTVLVYNHCQGVATQSLGTLTDHRNSVQHRVLSLPPYPNEQCGFLPPCPYEQCSEPIYQLYESTRLAAQMYSLLCVYPYPPGPAPFGELAIRLRKELSSLNPKAITDQESRLLLWILVMGAIMTLGTLDRFYFISILSTVSSQLQIESWQEMKSILVAFLWLDMTNDIDGRDIWDELNHPSSKHSGSTRFNSPCPSLVPSLDMTIRTRSTSATEIEEIPAADQPFSIPS
jgi:hypothetical protein